MTTGTAEVIQEATAAEVRAWARGKNLEVGRRGRLHPKVIRAFNKNHRRKYRG